MTLVHSPVVNWNIRYVESVTEATETTELLSFFSHFLSQSVHFLQWATIPQSIMCIGLSMLGFEFYLRYLFFSGLIRRVSHLLQSMLTTSKSCACNANSLRLAKTVSLCTILQHIKCKCDIKYYKNASNVNLC